MSDFNITLYEACEYLSRSKKTLGRYIRQGKLHPQRIKSQQGTLEYRFRRDDLEAFKQDEARQLDPTVETETPETKQDEPIITQDKPDETGFKKDIAKDKEKKDETSKDTKDGQGQGKDIIDLLQSTVSLLKDQLTVKDEQINSLIKGQERSDYILQTLQAKVFLLEQPRQRDLQSEGDFIETTPAEIKQDKPKKKTKETRQAETKQPKRGFLSKFFS
ncbi:MAG TPA: helix-turn-helix domain-containing protein [bacterium]|nr:helix-turn-helix domain-containing protein [bacterium]